MRVIAVAGLSLLLGALPTPTHADAPNVSVQQLQLPQNPIPPVDDPEALRRRIEILVRSGRVDEAIAIIEARAAEHDLQPRLQRRLARLYRDTERWESLEELLLEAVNREESLLDIGQLRLLAESRYELGRASEGRATLQRILDRGPNDPSYLRLVANVFSQRGEVGSAITVLVEGRQAVGDPLEFAQMLARLYVQDDRAGDAVREYCLAIVSSPLNVSLVRAQVLELVDDRFDDLPAMLAAALQLARAHADVAQIGIIVAELQMRSGDSDGAWTTLAPFVSSPALSQEMLRLALAGLAESRLPDAVPAEVLPRLQLSARVARGMLANESVAKSLEPRVYDTLVRSLLAVLENSAFDRLGLDARLDILDETRRAIVDMQQRFAGNKLTGAAILRLAGVYVDALHQPAPALELYNLLVMSPGSSREQVNLGRLGLARTYVAAGDTTRARTMFTAIGQDMNFVEGQGRAQYHLGMIDFMGGEFSTAQDRFKAVAMESPRADYTNDALDLALILVEQELSGNDGTDALERYGVALYQKATNQPAALFKSLETIATGPATALRERARLDLAQLVHAAQRDEEAVEWIALIENEAPGSRYTAQAMDFKGELLESLARQDEALATYESILIDYEDYVMMDRVRDRIRALRGQGPVEEEELP